MGGGASAPTKTEEFCKTLQIGDLIEFQKTPKSLSHFAVYIGIVNNKHNVVHAVPIAAKSKSSVDIIDYFYATDDAFDDAFATAAEAMRKSNYEVVISTLSRRLSCRAIICMHPIEQVQYFETAKVSNDDDRYHNPLEKLQIVDKALLRIGEEIEFHTIANNCEHFAKTCRYGKKLSGQSFNLIFTQQELIGKLCEIDDVLDSYVKEILPKSKSKKEVAKPCTRSDKENLKQKMDTAAKKEEVQPTMTQESVKSIVEECLTKSGWEKKSTTETMENPTPSTEQLGIRQKMVETIVGEFIRQKEEMKSYENKDDDEKLTNISKKLESKFPISDDVEMRDRSLRKLNVIIFGLPDSRDNTWADDVLQIKKLLEDLRLDDDLNIPKNIVDINRLGKYSETKNRPVKLRFDVIESRNLFYRNCKTLLKHFRQYKRVCIKDDLTDLQRDEINTGTKRKKYTF